MDVGWVGGGSSARYDGLLNMSEIRTCGQESRMRTWIAKADKNRRCGSRMGTGGAGVVRVGVVGGQWREEMPKEAVHVRPGCSTMRPSPVLNALAGHVIGSTAKPERRFFGSGNPSPVNSCR